MRIPIRRPITAIAAIAVMALFLVSCSDSGGQEAESSTTELTTDTVDTQPPAQGDGETTSEPFTYESDWGTFTLDPAIQARVQAKLESGEPLDIPVFSWTTGNVFFNPIRQGIQDAGDEFGTTSELLGPADPNQAQMISDLESYLGRQPDGIGVIPQNAAELEGIVSRLVDEGVPVVVYNTEMQEGSKRLVYVGQDNVEAGREAGRAMARQLNEKGITEGVVAMFAVDAAAAYSNDLRFPGFREALSEEAPDIEFGDPITLGNDVSAAVGAIDAGVRGRDDIVGIYVADEQVVSAGNWIKENAEPGQYVVVGHNLLPVELELVANGHIDALVGQNPYDQGYMTVQWLHTFLTTGEAMCGVVCDTGYPVVEDAAVAEEMLATDCDGKGCG